MLRVAVAFVLVTGCRTSADECDRAIARLERIDPARSTTNATRQRMLEACRTGKHAAHDPVLRCAIDSPTDEAAAACIDRGIKAVLKPSAGSGINPLLH